MLDISAPFSASRIKADIQELESLCELISQLNFQVDPVKLSEAFRELVNLAGSKEFYPVYSKLYQYVSNLKWAREGKWNTGYVVPWVNLYCALRASQPTSHLVMIANRIQRHLPAQDQHNSRINSYGNGCQPVDCNIQEWTKILDSVTNSNHFFAGQSTKSYHYRVKRPTAKNFGHNPIRAPGDIKRYDINSGNIAVSMGLPIGGMVSASNFAADSSFGYQSNNGPFSATTTVTNSPPPNTSLSVNPSPKIIKKSRKYGKNIDLHSLGLDSFMSGNEWEKHVPKAAGPDV